MAEIFLNPGEAATAQQAVERAQDSTVELAKNLTELTSELIQAILLLIKKGQEKNAEQDLESEQTEEKPPLVEIQAGKTKIFKGFEGQEPQRNSLSLDQIQLLQQLIQTPSTDGVEQGGELNSAAETLGGRVLTIKIDGDTVLRLDNGSLTNHLQREAIPELQVTQEAPEPEVSAETPEKIADVDQPKLEISVNSDNGGFVADPNSLDIAQDLIDYLKDPDREIQLESSQPEVLNEQALDHSQSVNLETEDETELLTEDLNDVRNLAQEGNQNATLALDERDPDHHGLQPELLVHHDDPHLENNESYDFTSQDTSEDTVILDDLDPDSTLNHNALEENESQVEAEQAQPPVSTTLGTLQALNAEFPDTFVRDELDTLLDPDQLEQQESQSEQDSPIEAKATKLSLGDTLRADLRKTFNLTPEAKQFVQGVGQAIKDRANQDLGKTKNFVAHLAENNKARQVANTALILLDATDPLGKGFEAEDYHIEALDRKTISIKGAEGQELLRFEDSPFGPKILNNNLTPTQIQEFSAARQHINKHGAALLLNADTHVRASYLGGLTPKGDRDVIRGIQNERAIAQATKLLCI